MFNRIFAYISAVFAVLFFTTLALVVPGPRQLPAMDIHNARATLTSAEWTNNNGRPWSHTAPTPTSAAFTVAPNTILVLSDSPSWPCPRTVTVTMRNTTTNTNVAVRTAACGNPYAPQTRGQFIITVRVDMRSFNNWMGNGHAIYTLAFSVA